MLELVRNHASPSEREKAPLKAIKDIGGNW